MKSLSESILTTGSFHWFHGIVEDVNDPLKLGRVKVRCIEYHNLNASILPTSALPWSVPMLPITSSSKSGVGQSSTGLQTGSWVIGFFRDGPSAQDGVIIGSIATKTDGVKDIPAETDAPSASALPSQYSNQVAPQYPHNSVIHTRSGHVIEYDDTPGKTRVALTHQSGSTIQILHDGRIVIASSNKNIEINSGSGDVVVKGANIRLN
jgi:hypothetical protein